MQKKLKARRHLLKALGTTGGITALTPLLPSTWTRPLLNFVALPAHAQTSDVNRNAEFLGIEFGFSSGLGGSTSLGIVITEEQNAAPVLELVELSTQQGRDMAITGFEVSIPGAVSYALSEVEVCRSGTDFQSFLQILAILDGINQGGAAVSSSSTGCFANPGSDGMEITLHVTGTLGTVFSATIVFSASGVSPINVGVLPATFVPMVN